MNSVAWEVTEEIPFPVPQGDGKALVRAVPLHKLTLEFKTLFSAGVDRDQVKLGEVDPNADPFTKAIAGFDAQLSSLESIEQQARILSRLGAFVSPEFCFDGPEDGKVEWATLHAMNQLAVLSGASRLSGVGPGRADALGNFHAERSGGSGARGSDPGAGEAAATAASGDGASPAGA